MKRNLRWIVSLFSLFIGLMVFPVVAVAHPLDAYLQPSYITVEPTSILAWDWQQY